MGITPKTVLLFLKLLYIIDMQMIFSSIASVTSSSPMVALLPSAVLTMAAAQSVSALTLPPGVVARVPHSADALSLLRPFVGLLRRLLLTVVSLVS